MNALKIWACKNVEPQTSTLRSLLFIPSSATHLQFIQRRTYNESAVDVVVQVVGGGR